MYVLWEPWVGRAVKAFSRFPPGPLPSGLDSARLRLGLDWIRMSSLPCTQSV